MLKLLGAVLLTFGGLWAGLNAAGDLRRRVRDLEAWSAALGLLESELRFSLPAMPELMATLARRSGGSPRDVLAAVAAGLDRLGEKPFEELWTEAVTAGAGALTGEDVDVLCRLGPVLGRYGWEDQCRAAEAARRELDDHAAQARAELERRGKTYGTLGASLGAFAAILLM